MISLKRYLDSPLEDSKAEDALPDGDLLAVLIEAYSSALLEMGNCSVEACPGMGDDLQRSLTRLTSRLSKGMSGDALGTIGTSVGEELRDWGHGTARHYQQKAAEVKYMLLTMARIAQSVGARDERCATQMTEVTQRLKAIGSLDDLTQIRARIEKCATDLKTSIDRMTSEGKSTLEELSKQVAEYRSRLEAAEELAWRDSLTGLSSRLYAEGQIERRIADDLPFCVAILDIDGFKKVNDRYGHQAGDELLKQFSIELRHARRATDVIGRWGGDEFILLLDCSFGDAQRQVERLREWICGEYTVQTKGGAVKFNVSASIGLAEFARREKMKEVVARADAAMYEDKSTARMRHAARAS